MTPHNTPSHTRSQDASLHDAESVDMALVQPSLGCRLVRALRGHVRITGFGLGVLALGLLIWARLMLVTNHPRVAVADPNVAIPVQTTNASTGVPLHAPEPEPHPTALASHGE